MKKTDKSDSQRALALIGPTLYAVASGWVSPGAATEGVTGIFFPEKNLATVIVLFGFGCKTLDSFGSEWP